MAQGATKKLAVLTNGQSLVLDKGLTLARVHGVYSPTATSIYVSGDTDQNVVYAQLDGGAVGNDVPFELNIGVALPAGAEVFVSCPTKLTLIFE